MQKNIPFVSYRLPGVRNIKTWIQLSGKFNFHENIHEVIDKTGFIYAPFHRKTNFPIIFFEPEMVFENEGFDNNLIDELSNKPSFYPEYSFDIPVEISKPEYLKQAKTYIDSFDENFQKAILSRVQIENKPQSFNVGEFFMDLQRSYPNAYCHLINIPGTGTWAGATPETLLRIDKNTAQSISLAGTQAYSEQSQNMNWQDKELEEQQIVTNYIEGIIRKFGIRDYQKEKIKNLVAGNAVHLATKFRFNKSFIENHLGEFISSLHPTPAVCGLPKEKALELILKTEKHNREFYSGFLGTLNLNGQTDLFVNLRCMKILPEKLALYVGGGLTKDSVAENEWEETELKASTLLKLL
jgi:isochorismate synthase